MWIEKLIFSLLMISLAWVALRLAERFVFTRVSDVRSQYLARKIALYGIFVLTILVIGRTWFPGFQSLATYLGLLSAGLAIALKEPIASLAGWLYILWQHPFAPGHRIIIEKHCGDVIDQGLFTFTLLEVGNRMYADQPTGLSIIVPNSKVFTALIRNYNRKGFQHVWNEVPVLVTFDSNWEKAKAVLLEIAQKQTQTFQKEAEERFKVASRKLMLTHADSKPVVYTSVVENGILLTLRYLCPPHERQSTLANLWETILKTLPAHEDIQLTYPLKRTISEAKPVPELEDAEPTPSELESP